MNDESEAQQHLEKAIEYEKEGKLNEALAECDLAIQLNPELAEAHNNKGIILELLGDLEGAIEAYEKAVELQPSSEVAIDNYYFALNEAAFQKRKRILTVTLVGALGFGLSLMLVHILDAVLNGQISEVSPEGLNVIRSRLGIFPSILLNAALLSIGIGMGTGILARVLRVPKKKILVISSFVVFGFLYLVVSILIQAANFLGYYTFLNQGLYLTTSIIQYALPGALIGLIFARIYGNSRNYLIASLAGSSLAIMALLTTYQFGGVRWILEAYEAFKEAYYLGYDPQRDLTVIGAIYEGLRGLIGGSVFGLALGLALSAISSTQSTVDSFLEEPANTDQNYHNIDI